MMKRFGMVLVLLISSTCFATAEDLPELRTVPKVDLQRYLGTWYEIARFPNSFQEDCDQATAQYSLREDGAIDVLNTCLHKKDKSLREAKGLARVEDPATGAKLSVTFLPSWLRWTGIGVGKYWIIDLGPLYEYAVVSEPTRKYLWILSRTPVMEPSLYKKILDQLSEQSLDPSKLIPSR